MVRTALVFFADTLDEMSLATLGIERNHKGTAIAISPEEATRVLGEIKESDGIVCCDGVKPISSMSELEGALDAVFDEATGTPCRTEGLRRV